MRSQTREGAKIRIRISAAPSFGHPMFGYICHLSLFEKVESLNLVWRSIIDLKIFSKPLPLMSICIFDNVDPAAFLKIKIALSINMSNKLVWAFPTCTECSPLTRFLHFHHRHSCNQTFKHMLSLPICIRGLLLLLCFLHIEQDTFMYTCYEPHLLQELCCNIPNINTILNHVSQSIQIVINFETR